MSAHTISCFNLTYAGRTLPRLIAVPNIFTEEWNTAFIHSRATMQITAIGSLSEGGREMKARSNVESFDSRMPVKFCGPRTRQRVPEGVRFSTGVVLTCWVPTLLLCFAISQALPLYLLVCVMTLGTLLGVWMYKKQPGGFLFCIPVKSYHGRSGRRAQLRNDKIA
jgi:hypothetical protein